MYSRIRIILLGLAAIPAITVAQSSLDLLKNSSDAGQQVFDQGTIAPPTLDTNRIHPPGELTEPPVYPGSGEALNDVLGSARECPVTPADGCLTTRVVTTFIVERDGSTTDHRVVNDACPVLAATALCALKHMARWTPGKLRGAPVRVRMNVPVIYELR